MFASVRASKVDNMEAHASGGGEFRIVEDGLGSGGRLYVTMDNDLQRDAFAKALVRESYLKFPGLYNAIETEVLAVRRDFLRELATEKE